MNDHAVPARDLVLRLCDDPDELNRGWLAAGNKTAVPFARSPGMAPELAAATVDAALTMGAETLLVFRTGREHAFEPVESVPARPGALTRLTRAWGDDDFAVALPDLSAALLVTASGFSVAAGPVPFVQPFVGADVAAAKEDFAEYAARSGAVRVHQAADRYGCTPPGGRHRREARLPGGDVVELASRAAARFRATRPAAAAGVGVARTVAGWAALAAAALATRAGGALPVVLGLGWLLTQVFWLARSHTLSFAGYLRMVALGAVAAVPVAALEVALAHRQGWPVSSPYAAVYVGMPVEEGLKLAPLLVLWPLARRRAGRLAAVDYLLLAAASGAGFQMVEDAARALAGGGSAPAYRLLALFPGWVEVSGTRFAGHAVVSGLVGAGLGIAVVGWRRYGRWLWLAPPLMFVYACLDHLGYEAAAGHLVLVEPARLPHALLGQGHGARWALLVLLVVAVLVDQRAAHAVDDAVPPLPGVPRWITVERAARRRAARGVVAGRGPALARRLAVAVAEAAVRMSHELAVILVAARRGMPALLGALRFVRERRELAMGVYRAAGRPRRDVPSRVALRRLGRALGGVLVGSAAALAAVTPAAVRDGVAERDPDASSRSAAFLAARLAGALTRWEGLGSLTRLVLLAGAAGVLFLLVATWSLPEVRETARPERLGAVLAGPASWRLLGDVGPGRIGFVALWLVGRLLPARVAHLLTGQPPRHAQVGGVAIQSALPPQGPARKRPAERIPRRAPKRPSPADEAGGRDHPAFRAGPPLTYPAERLRDNIKHAPDFGVTTGTPFDLDAFQAALRHLAEDPTALRLPLTYRGASAQAVVDHRSGHVAVFTPKGEFTGCALLTEQQLADVVTKGRL